MARIPYPDIEALPDDVRSFVGRIRPMLNIYRMLPHAETSLYGFMKLGNALLFKADLDPILRELVILRVGYLSDAKYEIHQHLVVARHVGVPDEKIKATEQGPDAEAFSDLERAILRFTDEVVKDVKASNAAYEAVAKHLSHREIAELLLTIGFYMMVSRFLENLEVEIEPEGQVDQTMNLPPRR
ncbi:MAG: carboxymuconolactone decarboxylase family protein [Alphaproteobacteria bacterium]